MMPLISALAELRQAAGIQQQQIAADLQLGAKAGPTMVSYWESGTSIPNVGHTCGYARLVDRQVVVTRDGQTVGDLLDVYPNLTKLRKAAGRTRADVATCLYITRDSVLSAEHHAGPRARLTTALQHLGASGYEIGLARPDAAVTV